MKKIWNFIKKNKFNIFFILATVVIGVIMSIFRSNRRFENMRDEYGKSKEDEGYKKGYRNGYDDGFTDSDCYQEGYDMGYQVGYGTGYDTGTDDTKYEIYEECKSDWFNKGFRHAVKVMSGKK